MRAPTLRGPFGWSIASILIIVVFFVYTGATLVRPFFGGTAYESTGPQTDNLIQKHDQYVAVDIGRFNGRSAFYKPIRIALPPPPPKPIEEEIPKEPDPIIELGPPPPPLTYTGPPLIAIIGEEAWFRSTGANPVIRLREGEELNGLKLTETMLPSMVKVEHRGGIYDVPLFTNEEPFFRDTPPAVSESEFFEEVEG